MLPQLIIDSDKLSDNIHHTLAVCRGSDITLAAVIKGFNGLPELARIYREEGCGHIASSRIKQLKACRDAGISGPYMMIRIPAPSEADAVVRYADCSLNSEYSALVALNDACRQQHRTHDVILMYDCGDLREGAWTIHDLVKLAMQVEYNLPYLYLSGIGTNLGCYGTIKATPQKMLELIKGKSSIEQALGRPMDIVSGGATSSFQMAANDTMPKEINHLRIGGGILIPTNWQRIKEKGVPGMHLDVFTLRCEIIEVKTKASYPVGELDRNCFGEAVSFIDRGNRKRAIGAIGRRDVGSFDGMRARIPGCTVLGGSSDHMIIDVEDCPQNVKPGDIMDFDIVYENLLYATGSPDVEIVCKGL
ncbi:MAG TPA: alanine racemase [Negativicutes bacterium]|nr:alanine racemase [Negativicutes bacterium]